MSDVIAPTHRTWLLRGLVAIALVAAIATWLAMRGDVASVTPADAEAMTRHATTTSEIAEMARRATVQVVASDRRGDEIAEGTGFFLSSDGLIATNYHVIDGASTLRIQTLDGKPLPEVYLAATDTTRDLAMLRVRRPGGTFLRIATGQTPVVGDPVFVMGNPLGQIGTFSTGVVSATREIEGRDLVQITAPISPGSSGGPVLNSAGEVIGVATLHLRSGQNMNFAVSSRYLTAMMATRDSAVPFAQAARGATSGRNRRLGASVEGSTAAAEPSIDDVKAQVDAQFVFGDSIARSTGYIPESRVVRNYLKEGEANRHPLNLARGGAYLVRVYCDNDCSLLGLSLRDLDDQVVDTDEGTSDHPKLEFAAVSSGRYVARVRMISCNVSPCAYGIRLYRRVPNVVK